MSENLVRKREALKRFPVGRTKFEEDIAPRLTKVRLGPRCVAFTESSIDRVVDEFIAESAAIPQFVPTPNKHKCRRHKALAGT